MLYKYSVFYSCILLLLSCAQRKFSESHEKMMLTSPPMEFESQGNSKSRFFLKVGHVGGEKSPLDFDFELCKSMKVDLQPAEITELFDCQRLFLALFSSDGKRAFVKTDLAAEYAKKRQQTIAKRAIIKRDSADDNTSISLKKPIASGLACAVGFGAAAFCYTQDVSTAVDIIAAFVGVGSGIPAVLSGWQIYRNLQNQNDQKSLDHKLQYQPDRAMRVRNLLQLKDQTADHVFKEIYNLRLGLGVEWDPNVFKRFPEFARANASKLQA